jgi:hypothetical protein
MVHSTTKAENNHVSQYNIKERNQLSLYQIMRNAVVITEYDSFFIVSGMELSPLYCGQLWTIVPASDDRWGWLWNNWWNEYWQGKLKYSEKTCPSAILSTTNPTWPDPGSNPGRRGGKPATNRLSYSAAYMTGLLAETVPLILLGSSLSHTPLHTLLASQLVYRTFRRHSTRLGPRT